MRLQPAVDAAGEEAAREGPRAPATIGVAGSFLAGAVA